MWKNALQFSKLFEIHIAISRINTENIAIFSQKHKGK